MTTKVRNAAASLEVFLAGIIDYAGLFPPAALSMAESVGNYARYRESAESWALGRFVLPVARLDEFLNAQENAVGEPWRLSGTLTAKVESELKTVEEFNRMAVGAVMDTVELRVSSVEEIDRVRALLPAGTEAFFEVAPEHAAALLPYLQKKGAKAKLRTGGVVQAAFPEIERVAAFLLRCAGLGVAFKATAGLHHPLRCMRPLTYEPESPAGTMHGFLNLFTAAAIAYSTHGGDSPREAVELCLADVERADWHFGDDAMTWSGGERPACLSLDELRAVRSKFALSFGSCSFAEPIAELREMNLL